MELSEIKSWAHQYIPNYNIRTAFTQILETIYGETDNKIEDIEKFYKWFKEKWNECNSIISEHSNLQYIGQSLEGMYMYFDDTDIRTCEMLFKNYIKNLFNINIEFWKGIACETKFFDEPQHFLN